MNEFFQDTSWQADWYTWGPWNGGIGPRSSLRRKGDRFSPRSELRNWLLEYKHIGAQGDYWQQHNAIISNVSEGLYSDIICQGGDIVFVGQLQKWFDIFSKLACASWVCTFRDFEIWEVKKPWRKQFEDFGGLVKHDLVSIKIWMLLQGSTGSVPWVALRPSIISFKIPLVCASWSEISTCMVCSTSVIVSILTDTSITNCLRLE